MTRSISLDLERRGFIVYIVCNTIEEEVLVQNESRSDIKPLMIDIVDVSSPHILPDRHLTAVKAQQRPRFHRALHSTSPNATCSFPRRKITPSNLPIPYSHPITELPLLTNRRSPA